MKRAATLILAAVALVGCGGGGGGGAANGVESKSPQEILAQSQADLAKAKSFHLAGTIDDEDGKTAVDGDIVLPGRVRLKLDNGGKTAELIIVGGDGYLRANKAFYEALGGSGSAAGQLVADKWVKTPVSGSGFDEFLVIADPNLIGRCLLSLHRGTLSKAGTEDVDGKKTVVLVDKGDVPGGAPGRAYIATEGDALPLRFTQTGPKTPGGAPDAQCKESGDSSNESASDLKLSKWNEDVTIDAPKDAVDLSNVNGQSQS